VSARHLVVLSRPDCELCHELLGLLAPHAAAGAVTLELRDLDEQPLAVRERQLWRIPVVLEGDVELMWGRIDAAEVERLLGPAPAR